MSIKLEHINYVYSEGTAYEKHALKDVSLEIPHGEFVGDHWSHRLRKIDTDPAPERTDQGDKRSTLLQRREYLRRKL